MALSGPVMPYSASAMRALKEPQDQSDLPYFHKPFGFTLAGVGVMLAVSRLDYCLLGNQSGVPALLGPLARSPVAAGLVLLGIGALVFAPWRLRRIVAFIDPCDPENAADTGYQVCQSLYAIGSGGVLGAGFANGQQKLFYLPYPYSDFIFSVVGEELGLIGTLAVVAAFGLLLWRGARAAIQAPDRFGY